VQGQDPLRRLLGRSAEGDAAAFAELYRATSAKAFGVVLRVVPERAEAEEVLQAAYLRVWSHAARYEAARASPVAWIAAIARNAAIDHARAEASRGRGRAVVEAEAVEADEPSPEAAAALSSDLRRLRACLDELEERHVVALRAAYLRGLTYRDIGAGLGVAENTVKSWIRRSLLRLRTCMNRGPQDGGRGGP
jgi:RNA polymerase sigma-70 factor (ECF subfamily)